MHEWEQIKTFRLLLGHPVYAWLKAAIYPFCSTCRRLYILRVLKPILSHNDLWRLYESLIESVILYCAPLFGDLPSSCSYIIRKIFRRARRVICSRQRGCVFSDEGRHFRRRVSSISTLLLKAQHPHHPLHSIVPRPSCQQDRFLVPFSNTNRRRNCFTVYSSIAYNSPDP